MNRAPRRANSITGEQSSRASLSSTTRLCPRFDQDQNPSANASGLIVRSNSAVEHSVTLKCRNSRGRPRGGTALEREREHAEEIKPRSDRFDCSGISSRFAPPIAARCADAHVRSIYYLPATSFRRRSEVLESGFAVVISTIRRHASAGTDCLRRTTLFRFAKAFAFATARPCRAAQRPQQFPATSHSLERVHQAGASAQMQGGPSNSPAPASIKRRHNGRNIELTGNRWPPSRPCWVLEPGANPRLISRYARRGCFQA